jgi:two-component system LytT family sensor kinase
LLFWVLYLANNLWGSISHGILSGHKVEPVTFALFIKYFIIEAGYILMPALCFYSAAQIVAPQIIVKKNYYKAALLTLATILFMVLFRYLLEYHFYLPVLNFDNYRGNPYTVSHYITNILLFYFPSYFAYGLMYFFIKEWYKNKQHQQELQKEKLSTELAFLRSQINPHFLFNTINDIYSLTYQKSDEAPAALLKLSEILRYMLREGNADFMPLSMEFKYLENVIELQRISAKGEAYIIFETEGYLDEQKIASLLLIAFVENAFKHGILSDPQNPVRIFLKANANMLVFTISNKKNNYQKDKTGGIGMNNVQRRLELMYPGKHELKVMNEEAFYSINLTLQLA